MEIFWYWILRRWKHNDIWWRCSLMSSLACHWHVLSVVKICLGIFDDVSFVICMHISSLFSPATYHQTSHLLHLHHFYINLGNGRKERETWLTREYPLCWWDALTHSFGFFCYIMSKTMTITIKSKGMIWWEGDALHVTKITSLIWSYTFS